MSTKKLDRDWRLNEFFGTIVVVNLQQATARLEKMTQELRAIGVKNFDVFKAVDGKKELDPVIWNKFYLNLHNIDDGTEAGKIAVDELHKAQAGCYMSHYTILRQMKQAFDDALSKLKEAKALGDRKAVKLFSEQVRRYSSVLVLEDDGGFGVYDETKKTVSKKGVGKFLRKALAEVPADWDMVYFIVNPTEPTEKISEHLYKIHKSWCFCGFAVNHTMYASIIERLQKIEDPATTQVWPVDNEVSALHSLHNVYCVYPSVLYTQAGKSYITGKTWDAWQGQAIYPIKK